MSVITNPCRDTCADDDDDDVDWCDFREWEAACESRFRNRKRRRLHDDLMDGASSPPANWQSKIKKIRLKSMNHPLISSKSRRSARNSSSSPDSSSLDFASPPSSRSTAHVLLPPGKSNRLDTELHEPGLPMTPISSDSTVIPPLTPAHSDPQDSEIGADSALKIYPSPTSSPTIQEPPSDFICSLRSEYEYMLRLWGTPPSGFQVTRRTQWIEWIQRTASAFRFHHETAYIGCVYFDIYTQRVNVIHRKQLQLLAMACIYVAGKMEEEIHEPICDDLIRRQLVVVTKPEILRMERKLLTVLKFECNVFTPHRFLHHLVDSLIKLHPITQADTVQKVSEAGLLVSAQAFLPRVLRTDEYVEYRPSNIAFAALLLALKPLADRRVFPRHSILNQLDAVEEVCTQWLAAVHWMPAPSSARVLTHMDTEAAMERNQCHTLMKDPITRIV